MVVVDEAKLDELYQQVLQIEKDIVVEREGLEKLSQAARLKVKKDNKDIRAVRESRRDELLESANSIFAWAKGFAHSPKGQKILSILEEVIVFRAHYFDCKPKEEKGCEAWLTCDCNGVLRYQEFYDGISKGWGKVLASSAQMVNRLHPDYIFSAQNAITRGQVWKEIEYAIKWRAEIFDIRRQRGWWPPQNQELEFS